MSSDQTHAAPKRARSLFTPRRSVVLALFILALVFVFENTRQIKIRLIIPEVTMPLYVALGAMLLVGLVVGALWRGRRDK